MIKFGKAVVKHRVLFLIFAILLLLPSIIGIVNTRINYDMLTYLPEDMDTVVGQDILMKEFGKGAFSFVIVEGMENKEVSELKSKIEQVEHVDTVLWFDSIFDLSVPKELLPEKYYNAFNSGDATMMAVFFDSSTSSDETIKAVSEIRAVTGKQCFVTGMSALVTDLKELCETEEPVYVAIAVILSCVTMMLFLDSWMIPIIFLLSIGMAIIINLGSNYFLGEISYITKALASVLQLGVTMDYSIFLWHDYSEQKERFEGDKERAMAHAIKATFKSVTGSSLTTIAGFIALCFMSFTLGKDLGIVMVKGVLLGVISCITILPSMILVFDQLIEKTKHRSLLPNTDGLANYIIKHSLIFLLVFALLVIPAYIGYTKTNDSVYYDISQNLPEDMDYVAANSKLRQLFDVGSTHMVLVDSKLPYKDVKNMLGEMKAVDGVKSVLGLEEVVGSLIPEEILPDSLISILQSDHNELLLINSEYKTATEEANSQIGQLNSIMKNYDENGMFIGEASCTKDMIEVTEHDFKVVNFISILAIFVIIMIVFRNISLPVILVVVIEFAIFINLGLPYYIGHTLPFVAPICISTIQLGATVDYAILMTTRYQKERGMGRDKQAAVSTALKVSIPSIIVSALGFFAATFGVGLYSNVDMISSMCNLMARGAIISMLAVIFILPAMLILFDQMICVSSFALNRKNKQN